MSDVMTISCPSCQTRYHIKGELAGKKFKCKKCTQILQAPRAAPTPKTGSPAPASAKAAPARQTPARPATAQAKPAPVRAQSQPAAAQPAPAPALSTAASRLLEEELAAPAMAGGAPPDAFALQTDTPAASETTATDTRPSRKCPHCKAKIDADLVYCTECGLAVNKKYSRLDDDDSRSDSKEWLIVLAGIGGALISSPLFFLVVAMLVGGHMAMIVCAIEINLIVSIGSFSLACRIFKTEPPEVGDILRIVGWSVVPANAVVSYLGGTGPLAILAGVGTASVISALLCMFQIQMPVVASILVSICYNIFAGILTVIGVVMLGIIFAGYLVTTGATPPQDGEGIEQMDSFGVPTSPAVPRAPADADESMDDDDASLDTPRDLGTPEWVIASSYARDRNWPVRVSTLTRSPCSRYSGT